jgi:hypothetical protein
MNDMDVVMGIALAGVKLTGNPIIPHVRTKNSGMLLSCMTTLLWPSRIIWPRCGVALVKNTGGSRIAN